MNVAVAQQVQIEMPEATIGLTLAEDGRDYVTRQNLEQTFLLKSREY
jgi:hypothetical protein